MEGKVKWFNEQKGYGFIVGEGGQDYFFHVSSLPEGTVSVETDEKVSFDLKEGKRGMNAVNIQLEG